MNRPLTRTPAPALDFSRPGTPAASDFGDIYFSTDGGLEETRAVFLEGCGLPEGWRAREVFTVGEMGFGSGLNFLATWQAWQADAAHRAPGSRLHFVSVEGYPFERDDLARALAHFPELAEFAAPLLRSWPGPVRGMHRRHFGDVTLTLVHDTADAALDALGMQADAWFLDGFSPAKNPDMWSPQIMAQIARLSAPGARLASFTVAGAVRRALTDVGFEVERKPGFGRKRQRLEARYKGTPTTQSIKPVPPTIIGAGIGGASIAAAFARRGLSPRVLLDPNHPAASSNGAAFVKPRFDLQDGPAARFFLSAFLYARDAYRDAVLHEGVRHLFKTEAEAVRFAKLAAQEPLGPGHMSVDDAGLDLPTSLLIDTEAAKAGLLRGASVTAQRIEALSDIEGPVILAGGYGVRHFLPEAGFRFARGQLSWTGAGPDAPVTYGGYAAPVGDRTLLGVTHDRITDHGEDVFALRPQDDARNLAQAVERGLPVGGGAEPFRASVRVNAPDTLPRLLTFSHEKTGQEIWVLSGLGSRGFVFAPLLGEALASLYLGEPGPLSRAMAARVSRLP